MSFERSSQPESDTKQRSFNVCVVLPEDSSLTSRFFDSFSSTLSMFSRFPVTFKVCITGDQSFEQTRAHAELTLENGPFDLIITYGISCTLAVRDLTAHQRNPAPLVFVGIRGRRALDFRIIKSLQSSGNHITGTSLGDAPFKRQFTEILRLNRDIKDILVVCNSENDRLLYDIDEVYQTCFSHKLGFDLFEINKHENYTQALEPELLRPDLVLTLRDSFTTVNIESIAQLCRNYGTKLCTSDWYSLDEGADMGFGFDEKLIGIDAAHKAFLILDRTIKPRHIPITVPLYKYSLRIRKPDSSCHEKTRVIA